uniref:Endoglucanase n=1 Tax=Kalanchoe fedtschenkoi TaxID=63787 RepID=A0A7N0U7G4_KALFE
MASHTMMNKLAVPVASLALLVVVLLHGVSPALAAIDYKSALTKSLLFFEAQRSGKLPSNQRVVWRGDSALKDGSEAGIDLSGGYYDAGDNVKFGFPYAFTITMLSWAAVDFAQPLKTHGEFDNALAAIRWGTDYLIKAHPEPNVLYGQVGDGNADHECWQRPEDMTTPRPAYKIDAQNPGSDLAGETAAAFAASSLAFKAKDSSYSATLLKHATQLYDFAQSSKGQYQSSIQQAGQFYSSSGYEDELVWAAAWLYRATKDEKYLTDILSSGGTGGVRSQFSWDDKYIGAQILIAKLIADGNVQPNGTWAQAKSDGESFICSCVQKGRNNVKKSPGGMLWFQGWSNLQYTNSAGFILAVYSDYLKATKATLSCPGGNVSPAELLDFARSQVDYILGSNPNKISYMLGFGSNYPTRVHHRAASIVSIKKDPTPVSCKGGFDTYFHVSTPNPNVLEGAIVGGPDQSDSYTDSRDNYSQSEPSTVVNAPLVGLLARVA